MVKEETRSGTESSLDEPMAAATGFSPASIFTIMDSDITMALSTSIPNAMIRDARDTWFKPIPNMFMTMIVTTMTEGIRLATTSPVRKPRKISMVKSTTTMAWTRLPVKSCTEASTILSCEATRIKSTPMGYIAL